MYYPAFQRLFVLSGLRTCQSVIHASGYGGIRYPGDKDKRDHVPNADWDKPQRGSYPGDTYGDRQRQEESRQQHREDKSAGRGGQPRLRSSPPLSQYRPGSPQRESGGWGRI
jgi:hypothetical protein